MTATRHDGHFFTDPSLISETALTLTGPDAHHLHVRRARPGEVIHVGDGAGRVLDAVIDSIDGQTVAATIQNDSFVAPPETRITVFQGLAKSGKVDWVVEKLVELGVDKVVVFAAGRSVPVWDDSKARSVRARWERVAHAASKQSRRAWLPAIGGPLGRAEMLEQVRAIPAVLVADPQAEVSLRAVLADLGPVPEAGIVIGPEGGLEREEIGQLIDAGATAAGLGAQILRTETAGLAVAAVLMHHFRRFG